MGEILHFPGEEERKIAALEEISRLAINTVIKRYGDGGEASDFAPSVAALPYHNGRHTLSVVRHTEEMAIALELSMYDRKLAMAAASAHDIDHTSEQGQAELESARWLGDMMLQELFPSKDIRTVSAAILGTIPVKQGNVMVGQKVSTLDYLDDRSQLIARAVACADMADLYSAAGPLLGAKLYMEYAPEGATDEQLLAGYPKFQRDQLELVRAYQFPHMLGQILFGQLREEVTWYHEQVLIGLEHGAVRNWRQLMHMHAGFMERNGG